jgi:hypothetical protein
MAGIKMVLPFRHARRVQKIENQADEFDLQIAGVLTDDGGQTVTDETGNPLTGN